MAFDEDVDVVVGEQPQRARLADQLGLAHDELLQLDPGAGAQERVQRAQLAAARHLGKQSAERVAREALVVRSAQRLGIARRLGIDDRGVELTSSWMRVCSSAV